MSATLDALNLGFDDFASEVSDGYYDPAFAVTTFDDFRFGAMGSVGDLPFRLEQQLTTEVWRIQAALDELTIHYGADAPESSTEALFQVLTGAGYDQNCDGAWTEEEDVLPFVAHSGDAFGGAETGTVDATVPGTGELGGVGFRQGAIPVVAYVTDNRMRDPDAGYDTPAGCPGEAGQSDVVAAAEALGAWFIGVDVGFSGAAVEQMEALALAAGSMIDPDGSGTASPLVYQPEPTGILAAVHEGLAAIPPVPAMSGTLSITLDNHSGVVSGWTPTAYETGDPLPIEVTVDFSGTVAGSRWFQFLDHYVELVNGAGQVIASQRILVVVPPDPALYDGIPPDEPTN